MGASGPLRLTSSQEELIPSHTMPYNSHCLIQTVSSFTRFLTNSLRSRTHQSVGRDSKRRREDSGSGARVGGAARA
eukprot:1089448-Pleurochrysis_carterae.AAC.1